MSRDEVKIHEGNEDNCSDHLAYKELEHSVQVFHLKRTIHKLREEIEILKLERGLTDE
jgi:hypothetical protein